MSKEKIFQLEKKEICITSSQIKQAIDLLVNENEILREEIKRLNNNINKAIEAINIYQDENTLSIGYQDLKIIRGILLGNEFDLWIFEEYLKELKGEDKE